MKCTDCHSAISFARMNEPFTKNLPDVVADGIEEGKCGGCGRLFRGVPRIAELSKLVIGLVLNKAWRLAPNEVRWARVSMGQKAEELARTLGVTASQVSRWETGSAPISALADRLLRMLVANFHGVAAPNLASIDSSHAEPVRARVVLGRRSWKVAEIDAKAA